MPKTGRPKLSEIEKALRKGKRLWLKVLEIEQQVEADPEGPSAQGVPGRPPVKYKDQLSKIKLEYKANKAVIRGLAEESAEPIKNIEAKIRETEDPSIGSTIGRPRMFEAQEIEYKIRMKIGRIDRIKAGRENERLSESVTAGGKKIGRAPVGSAEKISRLEDQVLAMKAEVRLLESQMSPEEKEDLAIRRLRRMASTIRAQLRKEGLDDLRIEAHKDWEAAKADRHKFPAKVLETVALELSIDERATKLKNRGYTPQ